MEVIQGLLRSVYITLVDAGTIYFRYTFLCFLIFWVILGQRITHFRIQPRRRTKAQVIFREIGYNFSSFIVFGVVYWVLNVVILHGRHGLFYDNSYKNISDYGWVYFVLSVFLLLVLDDTTFYWTHRLLHQPQLYHHLHKVHHCSVDPNPFTTYSFHPLEAAILFLARMLALSIIPLHNVAESIWALLTLLNAIVIHLGYEIYPRWFTKSWLTNWKTPSTHHNMHHEKIKGNYALIFSWWDKLMGTEFLDYQARVKAVQQRKLDH